MIPLVELLPRWWGELGRHGQGVTFLCPCCRVMRLAVAFSNPLDGGAPANSVKYWERDGEDFQELSLRPVYDASRIGHWQGWVTKGVCHP